MRSISGRSPAPWCASLLVVGASGLYLFLAVGTAWGGTIDFETVPGGVPSEGLPIANQFLLSHGVSFALEDGSSPLLAEVGQPVTAFQPDDTPLPGFGTGQFFLTDDGVIADNPLPLIITYAAPTAAAGGLLLDVDGPMGSPPETYTIEARDVLDAVLESISIVAGDPGTGDQLATSWSFVRPTADIHSIRIVPFRDNNEPFGLAFDQFVTSVECIGQAAFIDFETIPGEVGAEGLTIDDQFLPTAGISFALEGGGAPVLARVGTPVTAFQPDDTPVPAADAGQFFLTDDGIISGNPLPLIITYSAPTAAASGVLLDVDALPMGSPPETYTIEARDVLDAVLESISIVAGDPGTGDQLATSWSFVRPTADIHSIRIVPFRDNNELFGLAFDRFNACSTGLAPQPVPAMGMLGRALLGLFLLVTFAWRRGSVAVTVDDRKIAR